MIALIVAWLAFHSHALMRFVGVLGAVIVALLVANTLDTSVYVNIVTAFLALLSPLILKYIPAHDARMIIVCIVVGLVLALIGVALSGGLALDWHSAQQVGVALAAFLGLQQTFYAALRDTLRLDQP